MLRRVFLFAIPFVALLLVTIVAPVEARGLTEETIFSPVDTIWVLISGFLVFFMQAAKMLSTLWPRI